MTYYTTITINNSLVGNIQNHPKEFTEKIIKACSGFYYRSGMDSFGLGIDEHLITLQKPREFNENTVYVYKDGRLQEMNSESSLTNELLENDRTKFLSTFNFLDEVTSKLSSKSWLSNDELIINSSQLETIESILHSGDANTTFVFDNGFGTKYDVTESPKEITDQDISKWLKDNKINITISKLKKLK